MQVYANPVTFNAVRKLSAYLGFVIVLAGCVSAQTPVPRDNAYTAQATLAKEQNNFPNIALASRRIPHRVEAWLDQPFKKLAARWLTLDVFAPKHTTEPLPAIVLIHGGGWRSGHKKMLQPLALGLAQQGFVVASISYRLSPEAGFPAGFYDAVDAFHWFKRHGHKYRANTQFIALAGTSAGGQLASLVAYSQGALMSRTVNGKNATPAGAKKPVHAQALLNIDGLLDFTSDEALPFENDPKKTVTSASAWLGGRYEQTPNTWKTASAYFYASASSPPTLFLNSARARFHAGRDATIKKLNAVDIPNATVTLKKTPHTFWLFEQWLPAAITHITHFLKPLIPPKQGSEGGLSPG